MILPWFGVLKVLKSSMALKYPVPSLSKVMWAIQCG